MLYASPNIATTHRLARLTLGTPSFMRAPGEASGTFALESAMDELAIQLKIDPIDLRLRNYAENDPGTGHPFSSKSLKECYRLGAEQFGWSKRNPEPGSMRDGRWLVGYGMATATYPVRRSQSNAIAILSADGTALVQAGTQDIGTGTYTIMTQIAADGLGLPLDKVRFELGDTRLPETPVSGGSQTAASTGSAVQTAALSARVKLIALAIADKASPLFGATQPEVGAENGRLFLKADPSKGDTYPSILSRAGLKTLKQELGRHRATIRTSSRCIPSEPNLQRCASIRTRARCGSHAGWSLRRRQYPECENRPQPVDRRHRLRHRDGAHGENRAG